MDEISTSSLFLILSLLILCSAYFSSSETGMMSLNRYRLRHLAQQGNRSAKRVERLLARPDRLIGLILIGNNLVNIAASAIATVLGLRLAGDAGIAIATGILTLVVLIFAEVTPKTVAALHPERIAFPSSWILSGLLNVLSPLVWLTNMIANGVLAIFRIKPNEGVGHALSSEELRTVVHEAGSLIPKRHQEMLVSILDLEKVTVDDIMVPRSEIEAIDINDDWKSIQRQLIHAVHTRLVLYRDTIDEVIGIIHARDAFRLLAKEDFTKEAMLRSINEVYYIPEGTPLNTQLLKFQRKKERVGLIVDEYGDIQGLVTLEDILEEIVGDFTTSLEGSHHDEITQEKDGSYIVDGSSNIRDLNKSLDWDLPTDGPRTLNGLILEEVEDIPEGHISVRIGRFSMEVIEVADNKIEQVRIIPQKK